MATKAEEDMPICCVKKNGPALLETSQKRDRVRTCVVAQVFIMILRTHLHGSGQDYRFEHGHHHHIPSQAGQCRDDFNDRCSHLSRKKHTSPRSPASTPKHTAMMPTLSVWLRATCYEQLELICFTRGHVAWIHMV